ncbi:MAG: hypothetical protein C0440_05825 [Candidatus Pelagibacter sp.]|nr:hypothetical protein [Candidatus Pelagibacter sp.]
MNKLTKESLPLAIFRSSRSKISLVPYISLIVFVIIRNTRFFFQKSNQFISPFRRFEFMKQKLWSQFGIDISDSDWKKENRRENNKGPVQIQTMLFGIIGGIHQSIDFFIRIRFVFNHDMKSFQQLLLIYLKNISKSLKTEQKD